MIKLKKIFKNPISILMCVFIIIVLSITFYSLWQKKNVQLDVNNTIVSESADNTAVVQTKNYVADTSDITTDIISLGDIDNNGVQDSIKIEEAAAKGSLWEDKYNLRWTLVLNDVPVYIDYDEFMCSFKGECIDLDRDGKDEIFIQISPRVNSMSLEEYVVLKNYSVNDTNVWIKLQNFIEDGTNAFPIRGYVGNENPAMVDIVCEGFEGAGVIKADTTRHYQEILDTYKKDKKEPDNLYIYADAILNGSKYICGEQVAETAAWGIHKLDIDNIDGHNCIVATHGLLSREGGKYDYLGKIDVYFDYDNNGDIHILKMTMQPDKGVDIR